MSIKLERKVSIPEGVSIEVSGKHVKVQGKKGTIERDFKATGVEIIKEEKEIIIKGLKPKKVIGAKIGALQAHIKNMIEGVEKGFTAKLAVVYSHFPMNISVKGDKLEITNFAGAKQPKVVKIRPGTKVNIKGKEVIVEGLDKEAVGQTAGSIEQIAKVKGKDRRIYFDGIYIVEKPHKVL